MDKIMGRITPFKLYQRTQFMYLPLFLKNQRIQFMLLNLMIQSKLKNQKPRITLQLKLRIAFSLVPRRMEMTMAISTQESETEVTTVMRMTEL